MTMLHETHKNCADKNKRCVAALYFPWCLLQRVRECVHECVRECVRECARECVRARSIQTHHKRAFIFKSTQLMEKEVVQLIRRENNVFFSLFDDCDYGNHI